MAACGGFRSLETNKKDEVLQDRIEAGQAKQYTRSKPTDGKFIPFGRRQFVWSIEQDVRDSTEGEIIAYDGFENLAGRIRRGRSGFGWSGGWFPSGQRRDSAAEIIDAPAGTVFGVKRDQRRLMLCSGGTDIRRELSPPLTLESGCRTLPELYHSMCRNGNKPCPRERTTTGQDSVSAWSRAKSLIANDVRA